MKRKGHDWNTMVDIGWWWEDLFWGKYLVNEVSGVMIKQQGGMIWLEMNEIWMIAHDIFGGRQKLFKIKFELWERMIGKTIREFKCGT